MGKNLELASSRLMLGTDCQHVAAPLIEHVQTVVHQLKAYLKELIRIPKDFGKRRVELSLDVEFECLAVGFTQLHSCSRQSV